MRRWIVTGPTGAGKSALTRCLSDRGAAILDGDRLGHEILERPSVVAAIEDAFGTEVLADGAVDRPALGRVVFADAEALERLNRITHGPLSELMVERLDELASAGKHSLAVLEAAVYFLLPSPPRADLIILVTAPSAIRQQRLVDSGMSVPDARARIEGQRKLEKAHAGADVVVQNTKTPADLKRIADKLLDEWLPARD